MIVNDVLLNKRSYEEVSIMHRISFDLVARLIKAFKTDSAFICTLEEKEITFNQKVSDILDAVSKRKET